MLLGTGDHSSWLLLWRAGRVPITQGSSSSNQEPTQGKPPLIKPFLRSTQMLTDLHRDTQILKANDFSVVG